MRSKYIRTYGKLCPDDPFHDDDPRRGAIMPKMLAIHHAKTEQAVEVIEWWRAWPNPQHQTALEFVREARSMMIDTARAGHRRRLRAS